MSFASMYGNNNVGGGGVIIGETTHHTLTAQSDTNRCLTMSSDIAV